PRGGRGLQVPARTATHRGPARRRGRHRAAPAVVRGALDQRATAAAASRAPLCLLAGRATRLCRLPSTRVAERHDAITLLSQKYCDRSSPKEVGDLCISTNSW